MEDPAALAVDNKVQTVTMDCALNSPLITNHFALPQSISYSIELTLHIKTAKIININARRYCIYHKCNCSSCKRETALFHQASFRTLFPDPTNEWNQVDSDWIRSGFLRGSTWFCPQTWQKQAGLISGMADSISLVWRLYNFSLSFVRT